MKGRRRREKEEGDSTLHSGEASRCGNCQVIWRRYAPLLCSARRGPVQSAFADALARCASSPTLFLASSTIPPSIANPSNAILLPSSPVLAERRHQIAQPAHSAGTRVLWQLVLIVIAGTTGQAVREVLHPQVCPCLLASQLTIITRLPARLTSPPLPFAAPPSTTPPLRCARPQLTAAASRRACVGGRRQTASLFLPAVPPPSSYASQSRLAGSKSTLVFTSILAYRTCITSPLSSALYSHTCLHVYQNILPVACRSHMQPRRMFGRVCTSSITRMPRH